MNDGMTMDDISGPLSDNPDGQEWVILPEKARGILFFDCKCGMSLFLGEITAIRLERGSGVWGARVIAGGADFRVDLDSEHEGRLLVRSWVAARKWMLQSDMFRHRPRKPVKPKWWRRGRFDIWDWDSEGRGHE